MTAGEPTDGGVFRRGVLARIERGERSHRTGPVVWILAPIGAVAAIAVAVALLRPATPAPAGDPAGRIDSPQQPSAAMSQPRTAPDTSPRADGRNIVGPTPGTRAVAATRVAARAPDDRSTAPPLDRLAPPAALVVDLIPAEAIGIARLPAAEPIQVQRLDAITPIDVTPLGLDELPRRHE
jgi:hypothetical protein